MHAVTRVYTNLNWNGARSAHFQPQLSICQGDPVFPYLSVMCVDKLSHLKEWEVDMKKWHMFHMGRQGLMISHLMFADDLLLFGEATESQMKCVINTLNTLCSMSGQEVSNKKLVFFFP